MKWSGWVFLWEGSMNTHRFSLVSILYLNAAVAMTQSYQVVGVWICMWTLQWRSRMNSVHDSQRLLYTGAWHQIQLILLLKQYTERKVCKKVITWGKNKNRLPTARLVKQHSLRINLGFRTNRSPKCHCYQDRNNSHKPKGGKTFLLIYTAGLITPLFFICSSITSKFCHCTGF